MSDAAQDPGWWQAADGKWYPPPPAYRPPPRTRSGCVVAVLVAVGLFVAAVVIFIVCVVAITMFGSRTAEKLSRLGPAEESIGALPRTSATGERSDVGPAGIEPATQGL